MLSELTTLAWIVGAYVLFVVVRWAHRRRKIHQMFRERGIPGPKPNFLDGNMRELKSAPTVNDVVTKWIQEYGPVFGFFIGEIPHLIIKDIEMIKQVLISDFHVFPNRGEMHIKTKPLVDTVLALQNQRWKEVRSVLTPTFSSGKIKLMSSIMNRKVDITIDVVEERSKHDEPFDMYDVTQALTLDVIAECAIAMRVNCQKNLNDPFFVAAKAFFRYAHNRVLELAVMFPFISYILGFIARFVTMGQMTTMIVDNVKKVIKCRRNNPQLRRMDLLQLMLDSTDDTGAKKGAIRLTDDELIANAFVFLLAGYETTGTALALTFWLLVQHPDIQEKIYEEVMQLCPEGEISFECLKEMTYLDQVFSESLRLYPPVTFFTARQCTEEYQLGKYSLSKGMIVVAPIWDIQHDPDLWPDPWKFDPERFSKENKSNISSGAYFPFGLGPRNCIGMRFAQFEAKLAIAKLVRRFRFAPCEKTESSLTFICPTVIINPAKGVFLKAISRGTS